MGWTMVLRRVALVLALAGGFASGAQPAAAQSTTPSTPSPTAPVTPPPVAPNAPATPGAATSAQSPTSPTPTPPTTPPAAATPDTAATVPDAGPAGPDKSGADTSISQTFDLQPRAVIMLNGGSTWDEGFKSLNDAFAKLSDNLVKANVKATGFPMAIFTQTDDAGFKFSAMIPVEKAPDGKPDIAGDVTFGLSPGGKVMKFQHRSAYDDIDSTYEAITAYLDEKGLEAKNMFAEEYLNRTKTSDDPSLEVDILVFLK